MTSSLAKKQGAQKKNAVCLKNKKRKCSHLLASLKIDTSQTRFFKLAIAREACFSIPHISRHF